MEKLIDDFVNDYDAGKISRRELVARMAGVATAMAAVGSASRGHAQEDAPSFQAVNVNHIALRVTNVQKSRDFYAQHLGLTPTRDSATSCFMQMDGGFVALFRGNEPGMDHYCYSVENYDVEAAQKKLTDLGLDPSRQGNRIYFDDPDGLTVQLAAKDHSA